MFVSKIKTLQIKMKKSSSYAGKNSESLQDV